MCSNKQAKGNKAINSVWRKFISGKYYQPVRYAGWAGWCWASAAQHQPAQPNGWLISVAALVRHFLSFLPSLAVARVPR